MSRQTCTILFVLGKNLPYDFKKREKVVNNGMTVIRIINVRKFRFNQLLF